MSASNVDNAAGPRQVACETLDNDRVPADLDVLKLSRTFKKMYDDLGLEERDEFPGVFPVKTVSTRIFNKVIDWCRDHKDQPEPVIEKDPLSQECKWFTLTDFEKDFFEVPMSELLELVSAANYLDIPRLYHYACQSVAALIKGKSPHEICEMLQQNCDLDYDQNRKVLEDNPWLIWARSGAPIENTIFVPNEVLVTIFEKLPREDLERLQLVSMQFFDVIMNSVELSEQRGPLRVVALLEFGAYSYGRFSQRIDVWLRDGTRVDYPTPDYKNLPQLLKFATVQKLRLGTATRWGRSVYYADIQSFSSLIPVRSVWKNAAVEVSIGCFPSNAPFKFVFTELLFCKEIVLGRERESFTWSRPYMSLPAIAACNKLDISRLNLDGDRIQPDDIVEWLEHEVLPEKKWSEPMQMRLREGRIVGGIIGLLTALKTAFLASSSPKPYVVRIVQEFHGGIVDELLTNEKTHEVLAIRAEGNGEVSVKRA